MPDSFGARLRQRRQQRGIALATIADQTKIKLSLLEDLERDDLSHWPAGIFGRGFVRVYAHAIGLDPEVVVREFVALHPDPTDVVPTVPAEGPSSGGGAAAAATPTGLRSLVGSAMGSLSRLRGSAAQMHRSAVDDATGNPTPMEPPAASAADLQPAPEPDMGAAATVCVQLGQVDDLQDAAPLLQEAGTILGAVGLIVWLWHPPAAALRPVLAHGYSAAALGRLPRVERDADNATAAAFRSAQTCVVRGSGLASGALVIPLLTGGGCAGVLAIELQHGHETRESVRALGTIFAAQLARVVPVPRPANAVDRRRA